jgi:hypothetical protein
MTRSVVRSHPAGPRIPAVAQLAERENLSRRLLVLFGIAPIVYRLGHGVFKGCPVRLSVRTSHFHCDKRGSTPLRDARCCNNSFILNSYDRDPIDGF